MREGERERKLRDCRILSKVDKQNENQNETLKENHLSIEFMVSCKKKKNILHSCFTNI